MPTYLVEFYLPRSRSGDAAAIAHRVERATSGGRPVRLVQAVSVPTQELCLCLYDARSVEAVETAVRCSGLAVETRPEEVQLLRDLEARAAT